VSDLSEALAGSLTDVLVDLGIRPPRRPGRPDRTCLIAAEACIGKYGCNA